MSFVIFALVAILALGLLMRPRKSRKDAARVPKPASKTAPNFNERHVIRARMVQEAKRLAEMEDLAARFAEGTDSGISDPAAAQRAERLRSEAASLRHKLETECVRLGLPIGLVRHRHPAGLSRSKLPHPYDPPDNR